MKFKSHIKKIKRNNYINFSRLKFTRLDKNEKIDNFSKNLVNILKNQISSNLLASYPEVSDLMNLISKNLKMNPKNFLLTAGIDGALKIIIEGFTREKDKVVILEPTFAMTKIYCEIANLNILKVDYDKNLKLNIDKLIHYINQKPKLVILSNPNSPTGTVIDDKYVSKIMKITKNKNIPLIIDEAYYEFYGKSLINNLRSNKNLFILRTFSKALGIAGARVGYIVSSKKNISYLSKFKPMYEVNSIGIVIAKLIIKNKNIVNEYVKKTLLAKKKILNYLRQNRIDFKKTETNFILIDKKKIKKNIFNICKKNNILISDKIFFKKYLRITVGPINQMKTFLNIFKRNIN